MTIELPDSHHSQPAPVPLALKSNDGLGPLPEAQWLPEYVHSDDGKWAYKMRAYTTEQMRAERNRCYELGIAAGRERCAKLCTERAQLSWAAADETPFDADELKHEAVAAAMEALAAEFRA